MCIKILHIIPELAKGGAERLVLDICSELKRREDIEVRLVVFRENNQYKNIDCKSFLKIIDSKYKPSITGKSFISVEEIKTYINEFKPDIIHTHLWEAEIVARQIEYKQAAWFSHFHDNMVQLNKFSFTLNKQKIANFYERNLVMNKYKKLNNSFICISNHTCNFALNVLPASFHKRIFLLKNAIKYDTFSLKQKKTGNSILQLINIGSFVDKKNQRFLLDVVAILKHRNIDVKLFLAGDGANRSEIELQIQKINIGSQVCLLGNVKNVEEYLWRSDIYVHSATYEPFGLVMIEAMAAGLPVVCLDGGGNRDVIENGKNGYMIEKQDATEFAEKIVELYKNKELYSQMSKYAQEYAKRYDIKEYVDRLLEIYKNAPACKLKNGSL